MPTLTSAAAEFTPLMLPSTRLLLWVTEALAPIDVALVMAAEPFALLPMNELPFSAVLDCPALFPTIVFPEPVVLKIPAKYPKNELLLPVQLLAPAASPKNELLFPVALA